MFVFDVGVFRSAFPEFTDTTRYPSPMITFWAELAVAQVRECVWKTQVGKGVYLYTAHCIALEYQNVKTAEVGGMPGTSGGVANTKTVGSVTVGYDSVTTAEKDAGWWNLTNYGKMFIRLARIFGAGAIQL